MRYVFLDESKPILPCQAIKLSKTENISTANVRRKATFTDRMQSLLSYTRVFKEDIGVRFVDVRIMDIEEKMVFSMFLAASSRTTHVRYIRTGEMMTRR